MPRSILIVEDERIVAKDLQQTLGAMGYDAFAVASSADEAIAKASERCPDMVLMDIRIKGERDGIETATILRERFGVPVVYLTAHADEATIERAKQAGAHGYLLKPIKPGELRGAIEVSIHRHQMERMCRERERWFSTAMRSIGDAVIMVDLAGNVTGMNRAAEALTNTTSMEARGRQATEVIATPPEQARIIQDTAAPVVEHGRMLGTVVVLRDVTDERMQQKQLELTDRLSSLGTMAAGVAHELNNPLAVVMGNATFALEELESLLGAISSAPEGRAGDHAARLHALREAQEEALVAAARIKKIVADLQAFSRPVERTPGEADVARAVEWAARSTTHELRHRAHLAIDVDPVPLARIDETRLGQVIVNLLINSAHAIQAGNVDANEVRVAARFDEKAGRVLIEVRDTGAGMSPDVMGRIFVPFFTTKPVGVGTGLGLSICHGIVKSVGGDIEVESEAGKGTTFRLLLPAAEQKPEEAASRARSDSEPPVRGRILVVDDETMILHTIQRVLGEHELVCTHSAREALDLIEHGDSFDLIVSDVMMPMMTGLEFYEAVLARDPETAGRILFVEGGTTTPTVEDFLRAVPNARMSKPFDVAQLRRTVQRLLRQKRAAQVEEPLSS